MTIQLGIAPINWCNDDDPRLGANISFEQCIKEMALAGYSGTELGNKFPKDPVLLQSVLDEQGLVLSSAWFSTHFTEEGQYDATLSGFLDRMSFLKSAGASYINVCECGHAIQGTNAAILSDSKPVFSDAQWKNLVDGLHAIGRLANDHHMRVVYHYHAGTGIFTEQEIDRLMASVSPQLVSLLLDTGHAAFAGINAVDLVHKYGERIAYVHLKDLRSEVLKTVIQQKLSFMDAVRAGVFTVPGDGALDFELIINALKQYQYQGWMIVEAEQDPEKAPPLPYAQKAYEYLQCLIGDKM